MSASLLVCGAVFDGVSEELGGRSEILVRDGLISKIGRSVDRPDGAQVIRTGATATAMAPEPPRNA